MVKEFCVKEIIEATSEAQACIGSRLRSMSPKELKRMDRIDANALVDHTERLGNECWAPQSRRSKATRLKFANVHARRGFRALVGL